MKMTKRKPVRYTAEERSMIADIRAINRDPEIVTQAGIKAAARFLHSNVDELKEAFTQADIELALDDRGWLVGGKRMMGELDPLSRAVAINRARYYWLKNPLAKQAVRLWTDYAFSDEALTWESENSAQETQIDSFMRDRRNRRYTSRQGMRMLSTRLLVDGEIFFAFFEDGTVRTFDPLQITDLICDPDDEDTILAYKRVTSGAFGTAPKTLYYQPWNSDETFGIVDYGAGKKEVKLEKDVVVYHFALDPFTKRGTPLLAVVEDWLNEHKRFMICRVAITQALSQFAWQGTVKGGQKAVDSIANKMKSTYVDSGLSGGTEHNPPNAPGGWYFSNQGIDLKASPRATGASDAKTDADNLKLQVCAGVGIMLHYFGDPSTGNLATATAMELPMLKMFGAYQQLWKDTWRDLFMIVCKIEPEDDADFEIDLNMPAIIEDDLQALGTAVTAITTAFPEAKVPSVLRMCLSSLGIPDLDDVMEQIAENKIVVDAQAAQNREDILAGKAVSVDPKTGKPIINPPGQTNGGAAGTDTDMTEASKTSHLVAALNTLARKL